MEQSVRRLEAARKRTVLPVAGVQVLSTKAGVLIKGYARGCYILQYYHYWLIEGQFDPNFNSVCVSVPDAVFLYEADTLSVSTPYISRY
jgi:hypothetical protein